MPDRFQAVVTPAVGVKLTDASFADGCPADLLPTLPKSRTWTLARFKVGVGGRIAWLEFEAETPA